MLSLEDLKPQQRISGVIPGRPVTVLTVVAHSQDAIELVYRTADGVLNQRILTRDAEINLGLASEGVRPLDADGADFKLVAECQRIKLVGLFDPMLAVCGHHLGDSAPARSASGGLRRVAAADPAAFLPADDPGAGKTIMVPRVEPGPLRTGLRGSKPGESGA